MENKLRYEPEARMVGFTTANVVWALGHEGERMIHKIVASNVFDDPDHMMYVLAPFRLSANSIYAPYVPLLNTDRACEQAQYYQNKSFSKLVDDLDTIDLLVIKDQLLMPAYESLSLEDERLVWDYNEKLYCIALAIRTIERELKDRTTPTTLRIYGDMSCYAKEVIPEAKELEEGIVVYPVVETAAEMRKIRSWEREVHKQEEKILAQMLTKSFYTKN